MLLQRALVTVVLLPIGIAGIILGGWAYALMIAVILGVAGWEFTRLFKTGGLRPASLLVIVGILALTFGRFINGFESAGWIISLSVLLGLAYHLVDFERGRDQAGTDFAVTLAGIFYIGWIGAYFISLRQLEQGMWWMLLVLPATWFADSGLISWAAALVNTNSARVSARKRPGKAIWAGLFSGCWGQFCLPGFYRAWARMNPSLRLSVACGLGW